MSTAYISWEEQLLNKARVSFVSHHTASHLEHQQEILAKAYQETESVIRQHSRTFFTASALLPAEERCAARALYAFCRISDDIVDKEGGDRLCSLEKWKRISLAEYPSEENLIPLAWADTRARYHIPRHYVEQLLDGVALDLTQTRYETFADLAHYCYGVASTVGLMAMHIVGFKSEAAIPYAIKLGVALQLTNILRDVGEDWANGRVYLPQEELTMFGLCEVDIANGLVDDRWREFMKFQIARAHQLYEEALPGIAMLGKSGQFAIATAAELYRRILVDIEKHDYNVFTRRAFLSTVEKLACLPGIWWRTLKG